MTDEAKLEIFWGSGSPFAWRVLMAAELKGIDYVSHQLSFSEKEHKAPDYLKISPRGEVPAMRHGVYVLNESLAILAYLDAKYPEPPLFGLTPEETGTIWRWIAGALYHIETTADRIILPVFAGTVGVQADDMRAAAEGLRGEWTKLETALAATPWLAGEAVSAADLLIHSDIGFLLRLAGRDEVATLDLGLEPTPATYPAITAWRERTRGLKGYERAYPPHWREG